MRPVHMGIHEGLDLHRKDAAGPAEPHAAEPPGDDGESERSPLAVSRPRPSPRREWRLTAK